MSLPNWLKEEKLKKHETSKEEVIALFKIVERDIADADVRTLSSDRRFITAYNAALQLTTIVLRAAGFRTNPSKAGHHRITIDALPVILGQNHQELSDYLHACRIKRNMSDYTSSGGISSIEVVEIIKEVKALKSLVKEWVKKTHPHLHV